MRLVAVGTGTAAPAAERVQSGHFVDAGGVRLLMDCGSGVAFRMAALGMRWQDITHVAITHFHADHVLDLPTLLYAWRYGVLPPRSRPIEIVGPVGMLALLSRFANVFGPGGTPGMLSLGFPISIRELAPGDAVPLGDGVGLRCHKVPHTDESVAYSVERGARRIVYSGDTGVDASLGEWAAGCDVFLCECSLPESMAMATHLTPRQCGELAAVAQPGVLALTHFYPPVERVDVCAEVAERFGGAVVLTTDGWSLDLEER